MTNHGPFAVTGATLTDTLPAAITGAAWTCAASAGSSCPAAGAGSIATSAVNLLAGGTATFAVGGTVSPSASGTLANTATVAVPAGFTDPVPGNNSATDVDGIDAVIVAPAIAKAFGSPAIVVGETTLLTITVSNPNPSAVLTGVAFADALPAGVAAADTAFPFCGGTVSVAAGTIALAGGTLPAAGQCAIPVNVTGAQSQAAAWTNVIPSVSSIEGGTNPTPATAGITVDRAATTISIASDLPDPSAAGQPYTVSWSVVVLAPGAGTPGGSVTVSDGTAQCAGTLPATGCQLVGDTPGAKTLTATYAGDGNFLGSVSSGVAHDVGPPPPVLLGAVSRKQHGAAGSFDLPLSANAFSPTTEPRAAGAGASHRLVFTFDKSITAATVAVTEGTAVAGAAVLDGNDVVVDLSGVGNAQYVTVSLSAVAAADGGFGGSATARIGFLAGDVNGSRAVTLSDLLAVNAALAQIVTATNYLADVNLSGTLSLSDLLFVNVRLTQALP